MRRRKNGTRKPVQAAICSQSLPHAALSCHCYFQSLPHATMEAQAVNRHVGDFGGRVVQCYSVWPSKIDFSGTFRGRVWHLPGLILKASQLCFGITFLALQKVMFFVPQKVTLGTPLLQRQQPPICPSLPLCLAPPRPDLRRLGYVVESFSLPQKVTLSTVSAIASARLRQEDEEAKHSVSKGRAGGRWLLALTVPNVTRLRECDSTTYSPAFEGQVLESQTQWQ